MSVGPSVCEQRSVRDGQLVVSCIVTHAVLGCQACQRQTPSHLLVSFPVPNCALSTTQIGIIEDANFMAPWQSQPDTIYARPLVQAGDTVSGVADLPTLDTNLLSCKVLSVTVSVCTGWLLNSLHARTPHIILRRAVSCRAVMLLLQVYSADVAMPTWLCEISVTKPTVRQAIAAVKQVEKVELHLPIKPLGK